MDGIRNDDDDAPSFDRRELLVQARLRRRAARTDMLLGGRSPPSARAVRRAEAPRPLSARRASGGDSSDSESDSGSAKKKKAAATKSTAGGAKQADARLPKQSTTRKPARITPTMVFAIPKSTPIAETSAPDRQVAVGKSPSSPPTTSRAPVASPTTASTVSSSASPLSSSASPLPSSASPVTPDVRAPESTVSSQTPVAQETGFRFPGVEAAKQQDGAENDLRAGRFSPGAEAGIVIGTLSLIALLGLAIFCYRRKRPKSRGVSRSPSEMKFTGPSTPPRTQSNIMDEAMKAAYATELSPPMPAMRGPTRELEDPEQGSDYVAPPPPQNLHIYQPEQAPGALHRVQSMPLSDEPEAWRTGSPGQNQATRPLNWI